MENNKKNIWKTLVDFYRKDLVQYIVKRLLMFIPTLFLISILAFFVIQLPETDYVDREIAKLQAEGEYISQAEAEALRKEYGLDLPIHERYIK
jgi:peptide/nickel transport system permease protein